MHAFRQGVPAQGQDCAPVMHVTRQGRSPQPYLSPRSSTAYIVARLLLQSRTIGLYISVHQHSIMVDGHGCTSVSA